MLSIRYRIDLHGGLARPYSYALLLLLLLLLHDPVYARTHAATRGPTCLISSVMWRSPSTRPSPRARGVPVLRHTVWTAWKSTCDWLQGKLPTTTLSRSSEFDSS
jgi:hypothetical protein